SLGRSLLPRDPVHLAAEQNHVELASRVLPKRAQTRHRTAGLGAQGRRPVCLTAGGASVDPEAADDARAVIPVEVDAVQLGDLTASIDVSTRDGASVPVRVFNDRAHEPGWITVRPREAAQAFRDARAVVLPSRAMRLVVHLFPEVLPHVRDVEIAGVAVERETPRVPQSVVPGLPSRARASDKGIVRRNR